MFKMSIIVISYIVIISVSLPNVASAGTIYKYIDGDGDVVLTDTPMPEIKAKPVQIYRDMTDADKEKLEKEKLYNIQKYQESDLKRKEKEEKIRAAMEEYDQAIKDEQQYRANKNQASGYKQQRQRTQLLEEKKKELEEKKKKLQEVESEP